MGERDDDEAACIRAGEDDRARRRRDAIRDDFSRMAECTFILLDATENCEVLKL